MNCYECDGTHIFMRRDIECSIQRSEARLNRTYHLSSNENIFTIARMKNIHYLFCITSKNICCHVEHLINLNDWKTQFRIDRVISGQRLPQRTILR